MVGTELSQSWDVFDICDLDPVVEDQLGRSSIDEQTLAMIDLIWFFKVLLSMICNPCETRRWYQEEIIGFDDLDNFLSSKDSTIMVLSDYTSFLAWRNEFGTVIITDLTITHSMAGCGDIAP